MINAEERTARAIQLIRPKAQFMVGLTYDSLMWEDDSQVKPTESEFNDALSQFDALQYQRDRQYPSIGDQLDMQYWDQLNGTTTWKDAIAKVKTDNPKPE